MIPTKSLILSVAFGIFAAGAVFAQDPAEPGDTKERDPKPAEGKKIDAKALLEKVMKKHSAFKDFSCTVKQSTAMGPMAINSTINLKWKSKGKIRTDSEQMIPMMGAIKVQVVADGAKAHMYRSAPQPIYMELPEGSPLVRQGDLILLSLLEGDATLIEAQGLELSAEEVTVDGTAYERLIMQNPMGVKISYDFKKADGLVARSEQVIQMKGGGGDPNNPQAQMLAQGIKIKSTYADVKADSGLGDDVFKFTPPEGAEKVEGGGGMMPGMPGMPGGRRGGAKPAPKPAPKPGEPKKGDDEDF